MSKIDDVNKLFSLTLQKKVYIDDTRTLKRLKKNIDFQMLMNEIKDDTFIYYISVMIKDYHNNNSYSIKKNDFFDFLFLEELNLEQKKLVLDRILKNINLKLETSSKTKTFNKKTYSAKTYILLDLIFKFYNEKEICDIFNNALNKTKLVTTILKIKYLKFFDINNLLPKIEISSLLKNSIYSISEIIKEDYDSFKFLQNIIQLYVNNGYNKDFSPENLKSKLRNDFESEVLYALAIGHNFKDDDIIDMIHSLCDSLSPSVINSLFHNPYFIDFINNLDESGLDKIKSKHFTLEEYNGINLSFDLIFSFAKKLDKFFILSHETYLYLSDYQKQEYFKFIKKTCKYNKFFHKIRSLIHPETELFIYSNFFENEDRLDGDIPKIIIENLDENLKLTDTGKKILQMNFNT